LLGCSLE
jgi:hypothetical protein